MIRILLEEKYSVQQLIEHGKSNMEEQQHNSWEKLKFSGGFIS